MAGRRPIPIERQRLRGNPGKRALPSPQVILPAATTPPAPPKALSRGGKALWKQIWTTGAVWLSPEADKPAVQMLCEGFDQRDALQASLDTYGLITEQDGKLVANPALNHLRKVNSEIIRLLSLLGFTPTDRARMGLAEVRRVSAIQEFLSKKS